MLESLSGVIEPLLASYGIWVALFFAIMLAVPVGLIVWLQKKQHRSEQAHLSTYYDQLAEQQQQIRSWQVLLKQYQQQSELYEGETRAQSATIDHQQEKLLQELAGLSETLQEIEADIAHDPERGQAQIHETQAHLQPLKIRLNQLEAWHQSLQQVQLKNESTLQQLQGQTLSEVQQQKLASLLEQASKDPLGVQTELSMFQVPAAATQTEAAPAAAATQTEAVPAAAATQTEAAPAAAAPQTEAAPAAAAPQAEAVPAAAAPQAEAALPFEDAQADLDDIAAALQDIETLHDKLASAFEAEAWIKAWPLKEKAVYQAEEAPLLLKMAQRLQRLPEAPSHRARLNRERVHAKKQALEASREILQNTLASLSQEQSSLQQQVLDLAGQLRQIRDSGVADLGKLQEQAESLKKIQKGLGHAPVALHKYQQMLQSLETALQA